jgi:hypothetical protein
MAARPVGPDSGLIRGALGIALVAAAGYALLELACFLPRGHLLPWRAEYLGVGGMFFVLHAAVAVGACLVAAGLSRGALGVFAATLPAFAGPAALVALHAVTRYRESFNPRPRDVRGTLITVAIFAFFVAVAFALAFVFRRRAVWGRRVAFVMALVILVVGAIRVGTMKPVGEARADVPPRPESDRLAAQETSQHVFVLGLDGLAWEIVDPMVAAGRLPNLARVIERGRSFDLETILPTYSPVIWTSIATGKDRFQHGVHDHVRTTLPNGTRLRKSIERTPFLTKTVGTFFRLLYKRGLLPMTPYHSDEVTATSVFDVAAEAGLAPDLIEWYVTWPAWAASGVVVSDRFHLQRRGEPSLAGAVFPPELAPVLAEKIWNAADVPDAEVLGLFELEDLEPADAARWVEKHRSVVDEMRFNLARDYTTRDVALDLLERDPQWRLFAVYFRAVDASHHLAWKYRNAPGDPQQDPNLRLRTVVERYHEIMDAYVGEILAEVPEDAALFVLSDHGFEDVYAHSRAPDGFAVLAGGPFLPSQEKGRLHVYDIAPTIAVLLGLPVAEDLVDGPRSDLLSPAFLAEHPVRTVSTWERVGARPTPVAAPAEAPGLAETEIERLRALGYIQ